MDSRFRMVYSLKEANGPFFFAELIPTFCSDAQTTIREMTLALYISISIDYDSISNVFICSISLLVFQLLNRFLCLL